MSCCAPCQRRRAFLDAARSSIKSVSQTALRIQMDGESHDRNETEAEQRLSSSHRLVIHLAKEPVPHELVSDEQHAGGQNASEPFPLKRALCDESLVHDGPQL